MANDFDPENDTIDVVSVAATGNGDVVLNGDGTITYTPDAALAGVDTFTYTISDGELTASSTVVIDVTDDYIEFNITGTEGNDKLFGDLFSENAISGLGGNDNIHGGFENDYIDGGAGNDHLFGRSGNDELIGGLGDDKISGGMGDDLIYGGSGNDKLFGGQGADTFFFGAGDGQDTVFDFNPGAGSGANVGGDRLAIDIEGIDNFSDLMSYASHQGNTLSFDFGNGDMLILKHTQLAALDEDMFTFA